MSASISPPRSPRTCSDCHLREQCLIGALTSSELAELGRIRGPNHLIETGASVAHEGDPATDMFTVFDGWAIKYRILESGKRQIVSLAMPGDLIGEYAKEWSTWQYSVEAISPMSLCSLDRLRLVRFRQDHPHLSEATIDMASRYERMMTEHLVNAARRSARAAVAHLLLEIFMRLQRHPDRQPMTSYFTPLTQEHIGDMIGLSTEYVNRLLGDIRATGWINLQNRRLSVPDLDRASEAFDFDASYLDAKPRELAH